MRSVPTLLKTGRNRCSPGSRKRALAGIGESLLLLYPAAVERFKPGGATAQQRKVRMSSQSSVRILRSSDVLQKRGRPVPMQARRMAWNHRGP
jgi:hypothetical protein